MLETIKNLIAIIAPLAALVIAWRGLSTWNRQLYGTRDSELSKRILVALYNIELIIEDIRSPFVEYPLPEGVSPLDQEASNKAWADHYEAKFRRLFETVGRATRRRDRSKSRLGQVLHGFPYSADKSCESAKNALERKCALKDKSRLPAAFRL